MMDYQNGSELHKWEASRTISYFLIAQVAGYVEAKVEISGNPASLKSISIGTSVLSQIPNYGEIEFRKLLQKLFQINSYNVQGKEKLLSLEPLVSLQPSVYIPVVPNFVNTILIKEKTNNIL